MWVGVQISVEKNCIFGKKSVGPKNVEEKTRIFWKKIVGGYQITPGTNFQHMFRKFLPDPPLFCCEKIQDFRVFFSDFLSN